MSQNKFLAYQHASLSQKVSFNIPILKLLSGTDQELSDSIGVFWYLGETGVMDKNQTVWIMGLLDVLRLSHLATSPTTNEITKLGFMLPKEEALITDYNEEG